MAGVKNEKLFIAKLQTKSKKTAALASEIYVGSRDLFLSDIISDATTIPLVYPGYSSLPNYSSAITILDPSAAATVDSLQRISQLTDQGPVTGGNHGTQSTDASKPILTRSDNKSNILFPSYPTAGSDWSTPGGTFANMSFAAVSSGNWSGLFTTAAYFVDNTDTRYLYRNLFTISGVSYNLSFYVRRSDNAAVVTPGDFQMVALGNLVTATITSLGGGLYRASYNFTGSGTSTNFGLAKTAAHSAVGIYAQGFQLRYASTDSDYLATTTYPAHPGANGKRAAFFDGVDDHLINDALATSLTGTDTPMTVIAVARSLNNTNNTVLFGLGRNSTSTPLDLLRFNSGGFKNNARRDDASSLATANFGASNTNLEVLSKVFSGTDVSLYVNGAISGTANQSANVGAMSLDRATIMARSAGGTVSEYTSGYLLAMVVFNVALSAADRVAWETFLTNKFINNLPQPASGYKDTRVHGVLLEINGLGQSMGEVIADDKYGSLQLDVTRGSFGFDTRIYDLMELETFLHQSVAIWSVEVQEGVQGISSEWDLEFSGEVSHIGISTNGKTMTLDLKSPEISYKSPNYLLSSAEFPALRSDGQGKYLPLIFNQAEVPALYAVDNGGIGPTGDLFIYARNLIDFPHRNVLNYYAKNFDGNFVEVFSAASKTTTYLGRDLDGNEYVMPTGRAKGDGAWTLSWSPSQQRIYVHAFTYFKDKWSGTAPAGSISVEIWETGPNGGPVRMVASCRKDKAGADFSWANDLKNQIVKVSFEKPIVLDNPYGYYFAVDQSSQDGSNTLLLSGTLSTGRSMWEKNDNTWSPYINTVDGSPNNPYYGLKALVLASEFSNPSFARIQVFQDDLNPATDLVYPVDLGNLEIVVKSEGITDDSAGNMTGTPDKLLQSAYDVIRALYYLSQDGSLAGLDSTIFSAKDYAPIIAGATEGQQEYRNIILEILENCAMKLVPRRGTNSLALWAYGVRQNIITSINESDCVLEGFEVSGLDSIVNQVKVVFDKTAIPSRYSDQASRASNYRQSLERNHALSAAIYGVRSLSADFNQLNYVKDAAVADRWCDYKFSQYAKERTIATFSVPFWKNDYRKIELMDIIDFSHIDNPSYFGSASSAQEPRLTTDGINHGDDYMMGDLWRRAKRYPMRILSRIPSFSFKANEARIQFRGLVLDNPEEII